MTVQLYPNIRRVGPITDLVEEIDATIQKAFEAGLPIDDPKRNRMLHVAVTSDPNKRHRAMMHACDHYPERGAPTPLPQPELDERGPRVSFDDMSGEDVAGDAYRGPSARPTFERYIPEGAAEHARDRILDAFFRPESPPPRAMLTEAALIEFHDSLIATEPPVDDMVKAHLRILGADGLCDSDGCGCDLEELFACGTRDVACVPAKNNPEKAAEENLDFWMEPLP